MGKVVAVCRSEKKGTQKINIKSAEFIEDYGMKDDAHAGKWHRQISLLSKDKIEDFRARGVDISYGAFGENLVVEDIDFAKLPIGTTFKCNDVILELTQIGKKCHNECEIYNIVGDCIMPREGVFTRVLHGGQIQVGDNLEILKNPMRVAIITSSDSGYTGEREDLSGPAIKEIMQDSGYQVVSMIILPDKREDLEKEMIRICDERIADIILTTGGTGLSPTDCMPEATENIGERRVPGIPEAMRQYSMQFTKRAMLSRATCVTRKSTLILNLPGSPKAVRECLDYVVSELDHGLEIMVGKTNNCAREGGLTPHQDKEIR